LRSQELQARNLAPKKYGVVPNPDRQTAFNQPLGVPSAYSVIRLTAPCVGFSTPNNARTLREDHHRLDQSSKKFFQRILESHGYWSFWV